METSRGDTYDLGPCSARFREILNQWGDTDSTRRLW